MKYFIYALTLAFIVLKLTNAINWSWWWVLSPIWISLAIYVILVIAYLLLEIVDRNQVKKRYTESESRWNQRFEQMQNKKTLQE